MGAGAPLGSYEFDSFAKAATIDLPVVMFHGWPDSYMRQSDARILLDSFEVKSCW
jgi:hypothetical protein